VLEASRNRNLVTNMSVQFGKCNFGGNPVEPHDLDRVRSMLAPHGPDAEGSFCKDNFGVIYHAFYTTKESRLENQPHVMPTGTVITCDGRLDNREELVGQFRGELSTRSTDISIFAAAYGRWGLDAFAKLIGDWAVSIWDARSRSLIFATDFVGTRHLYYSIDKDRVTWSTILDPLVLLAGKTFSLSEEYIAGWLSLFPASHLTPYVGIYSVTPSSFLLLQPRRHVLTKYWDFDPSKTIRYGSDFEYEEHFRTSFANAIRRRLRSDSPVLAELSGGMDSSSIVCMADAMIERGASETPRLDTISYFNDSEPNWNEHPYFTKVEQRRHRSGCHIEVGPQDYLGNVGQDCPFAAIPGSPTTNATPAAKLFSACVTAQGNRVLLSGIGGDEVLGGVPTPIPELQDLIVSANFRLLARQLKLWAVNKRSPWFHLLFEALGDFLPRIFVPTYPGGQPAFWLDQWFVERNQSALRGYRKRLTPFGPVPSFQGNLGTLNTLRRQLSCDISSSDPPCERRYPYLDRCLLEFLYAIPREQLVRPGQRRSLMRRAMRTIVPDEIIDRKRKAFIVRTPLAALPNEWAKVMGASDELSVSSLGIVNRTRLYAVLEYARQGREVPIGSWMRTLLLELWLAGLVGRGLVSAIQGETGKKGFRLSGDALA